MLGMIKSNNGGLSEDCIPWVEGLACAFISSSSMVLSCTFSSFSLPASHSMVEIIALQWPFGFSSMAGEKLVEEVYNCLVNCPI